MDFGQDGVAGGAYQIGASYFEGAEPATKAVMVWDQDPEVKIEVALEPVDVGTLNSQTFTIQAPDKQGAGWLTLSLVTEAGLVLNSESSWVTLE
jgi:hypothetical protein